MAAVPRDMTVTSHRLTAALLVIQAEVKRRADAVLVRLLDLPEGTEINLETCDTGCRSTRARSNCKSCVA